MEISSDQRIQPLPGPHAFASAFGLISKAECFKTEAFESEYSIGRGSFSKGDILSNTSGFTQWPKFSGRAGGF